MRRRCEVAFEEAWFETTGLLEWKRLGQWLAMWEWIKGTGAFWSTAGEYGWSAASWALLSLSAAMGLLGVVIPVIPGAIVLLVGALLFHWMSPGWLSWWTIGVLGAMVVLDRVVDFVGTAAGTKWFGGTKWGIFGALTGGLVGLFFGPFGLIFGPVIGAFAFELAWARRHPKQAARSGLGAGVGFGLSMLGRLGVCLLMLAALGVDLFWYSG